MCNVLADSLSGNGHAVKIQKILLGQLIHNGINAACLVQLLHIGMSCRSQMTQIRSLCTDSVCNIDIKLYACLSCDGRKMQHTVCGASKRHINGKCIDKCLLCHDVSRADILLYHFHNFHSGMLCKLDSLGIYSRNRSVALKTHTKCLSQTVHRVCGIHTGTGAAGRTGLALILVHILFCHLACRISTNCLKHGGKTCSLSLYMTCKHRTTADKYSRDIDSGCCH